MPMHRRAPAQAYASLGLETRVMSASPVRLISLLFDGARAALARARQHMDNASVRGVAISKAINIIDSGLKASLDTSSGGEVAASLHQAYDLVIRKLLLANLKADTTQLEAAERLLTEIGAAWISANDPGATTH